MWPTLLQRQQVFAVLTMFNSAIASSTTFPGLSAFFALIQDAMTSDDLVAALSLYAAAIGSKFAIIASRRCLHSCNHLRNTESVFCVRINTSESGFETLSLILQHQAHLIDEKVLQLLLQLVQDSQTNSIPIIRNTHALRVCLSMIAMFPPHPDMTITLSYSGTSTLYRCVVWRHCIDGVSSAPDVCAMDR